MNKTIEDILQRRSVRKYNDKMVSKEDLETIVKAASYAPSAMNCQPSIVLVVQQPELLEKLRRLNATSVGQPYERDNFYGAKTVLVVLADKNNARRVYDGTLVMSNIMLAAQSLGISSCWIHRAKETFETEEGKQILKDLGIEGEYEGIGNCILGYSDDKPEAKPRKENFAWYVL